MASCFGNEVPRRAERREIQHQQGESLQSTVDKSAQQSEANFYRGLSLPGYVARPGEHGAYGFSKVTPMGLLPYSPGK